MRGGDKEENKNLKIMVLYNSGVGSNKTIAEIFHEKLNKFFSSDIESISKDYNYNKLFEYDFIVLGFPTYHCEPSESMKDFINKMPKFKEPKNAFIFTTYGLFSGNTERIFIKACMRKNINVCGSNGYKSPATDGVLLLPSINFMLKYGKSVPKKIKIITLIIFRDLSYIPF